LAATNQAADFAADLTKRKPELVRQLPPRFAHSVSAFELRFKLICPNRIRALVWLFKLSAAHCKQPPVLATMLQMVMTTIAKQSATVAKVVQ
jgi:hypothetical protein